MNVPRRGDQVVEIWRVSWVFSRAVFTFSELYVYLLFSLQKLDITLIFWIMWYIAQQMIINQDKRGNLWPTGQNYWLEHET